MEYNNRHQDEMEEEDMESNSNQIHIDNHNVQQFLNNAR